ncbi:MAG: gp16 family protein [Alphaproteobacteria bacterium]
MVNSLIAKIHIAKNELGLDDETYRSLIFQATGKKSCTECNQKQLGKILELMKSKGWKPSKPKKAFRNSSSALIRKIYGLWSELHSVGKISSADKTSLDKFVSKHTEVDSAQWLDNSQAVKIIEMLKQWLAR